MKLLTKTSILIITVSIFIFWAGNIVFFYISREMINKYIDSELETQMNFVDAQLDLANSGSGEITVLDKISVTDVDIDEITTPVFKDTVLFSFADQHYIPHRALTFYHKTNNRYQEITIYKSLLASDKLIERISVSSIILLISFIVMIYFLNRYIFANVWSEFSASLMRVEDYDIKSSVSLELPDSDIDEFDKLNRVLLEMVDRIQSDYRSLKVLTANTSHEIQTPLAIIRNKAEILMQSENLGEPEMELLGSILSTTERLSKLNQSLLLIARIENHQFEESEMISLPSAIEKNISNLDILLEEENIKINQSLEDCPVIINPVLLDVLISNLLKNAITHGEKGHVIDVGIRSCVLSVSNAGEPLSFPSEFLFKRFFKGSGKKGSTGIGLEIVRKVCNYYKIGVRHAYDGGIHTFMVDFSSISEADRSSENGNKKS